MTVYIGKLLDLLNELILQAFVSPWRRVKSVAFSSNEVSITRKPIRKKSIVRIIGTYLPLPAAPRVYLNLAAWNNCSSSYTSSIAIQERCLEEFDDEISKEEVGCHSEACNAQAAIQLLKDELYELKIQIAAILENQSNSVKEVVSDVGTLTDSEEDSRLPVHVATPPTPPTVPPPPPLPPPPQIFTPGAAIPIRKKGNANCGNSTTTPPSALHILGQVLSEMKNGRPKLKPIQRSPGGGPLKQARISKTDPSDVLTEVLRRRYSAAQMSDTYESDTSSQADIASSPDWRVS